MIALSLSVSHLYAFIFSDSKMVLDMNFIFLKDFYLIQVICFCVVQVSSVNKDGSIILEFKKSLLDPQNSLHDWNSSDLTPCSWTGVHCNDSVVTSILLHQLNLSGSLSPIICKLPHLALWWRKESDVFKTS